MWRFPKYAEILPNSNTSCLRSSNIAKSKLDNLSNLNILSSIENISSLSNIDDDINLPYQCNFKYYSTPDFHNSQEIRGISYTQDSFSILHCNKKFLAENFDSLSNIIGLSQTKLLNGKDPIININLPYFNFISNQILSSAGGGGTYIKDTIKFTRRDDKWQNRKL